jgi:hypothetical protein
MTPIVVQRHPQGPRVWIAGQRIHHGASGTILGAAALLARRRRLGAVLLAWALTDWHDVRVWFKREGIPAVRSLTPGLDDLSIPAVASPRHPTKEV